MAISLDEASVPWDISAWRSDKRQAAIATQSRGVDAIPEAGTQLKGVLLTHEDPGKIYLAPDPERLALVLEIAREDIEAAEESPGEGFLHSGGKRAPLVDLKLVPSAVAFPVLAVPKTRLPGFIDGMSGSNPKDPQPKEPTCPTGVRGGIRP